MKGRRCSSCSTRFDCSLIGTEVINEQPASKMVFRPVRVGHTQRQPGPNPATGTDPCLSHEPQPDGGKGRSSRHRRRRAHRQGGCTPVAERNRRLSGIRRSLREQLFGPFARRQCKRKPLLPALSRRTSEERHSCRRCRSEEHTSELQSLMRNSYAVLCLK